MCLYSDLREDMFDGAMVVVLYPEKVRYQCTVSLSDVKVSGVETKRYGLMLLYRGLMGYARYRKLVVSLLDTCDTGRCFMPPLEEYERMLPLDSLKERYFLQ